MQQLYTGTSVQEANTGIQPLDAMLSGIPPIERFNREASLVTATMPECLEINPGKGHSIRDFRPAVQACTPGCCPSR